MTFRRFAPALALSFLMVSCAAETTPEQKARAEQQRRAAITQKRAEKARKAEALAEAERKRREAAEKLRKARENFRRLVQRAQAAEKSGKLRKAFALSMQAFRSILPIDKEKEETPLRERILRVTAKLDPPPAIPKEIERFSVRASVFLKRAQSKEDYGKPIAEYQKALNIAPWWVDGYFNLALVQEKAEIVAPAIRNLKLYLLGRPNAPDTRSVRRKIFALEALAEELDPIKPWLGKWRTKSGSRLVMKSSGKKLALVYIQPSPAARKSGYRPGGKLFSGKLVGNKLKGKIVFQMLGSQYIRCLGKKKAFSMTAVLSPGDNTIKLTYRFPNYKIKTCQIIRYFNATMTYTRIP